MKKLAVLVSGSGSDLQTIIDGIASKKIAGEIAVVVSDKPGAYALTRAEKAGIATAVVDRKAFAEYKTDKTAFTKAVMAVFEQYQVEGIVFAGFLSILGGEAVAAYKNKMINIHPSLIPSFCGIGFYGIKVHQAAIDYGVKLSGVTIHFVDEGTDTGPIIAQRAVIVKDDDTAEELQKRVLAAEHALLPEVVALFCADKIKVEDRKVYIQK